jgi:putative membrane protein
VKALAHRLAEVHEGAETALPAAADGSAVTIATALDPNHQARVTALQRKSGAGFDKAYVADQVALHSNALTLYGDCMLLSGNKKLKTLALKMIPVTETQLDDIRALSEN